MQIAVIGAKGQLGGDLVPALANYDLVPLSHVDIEVTDPLQVRTIMQRVRPHLVVNLSAYHRVDECEDCPERAFQVNALAVRHLALACREMDAALLHISTDYVFDGRKGTSYVETDAPNPINVYGLSKLAGEYFIKNLLDRYFLIRTSGLYGVAGSSGKGGNFVELMLRLAHDKKPIRVVVDQVLSPTYTSDLAQKISELIKTDCYGTYHITNAGECSWHDFARKIFESSGLYPDLSPTTSTAFGSKANRPAYSALNNTALAKIGLGRLRPWQDALADYLSERNDRA